MNKRSAAGIGEMAVRALLMEAAATPKPGLVDRENSGAHRDMDYPLFLVSAKALQPCFTACAQAGLDFAGKALVTDMDFAGKTQGKDMASLAGLLRKIGIRGEQAMFAATKGVNTHKGLVFSMGILCCSLGLLETEEVFDVQALQEPAKAFDTQALQHVCREVAKALLDREETVGRETHGRQAERQTGIGGVRAEALGGFSGAFTIGLPTLQQAVKRGQNMNQAMVTALLQLMTCTEDSNAVYRGGLGGLTFLQQGAETLLQAADPEGTVDFHAVRDFDRQCTERNLSPGGSADLLALSAMLYLILEDEGGREACWKEQLPEQ